MSTLKKLLFAIKSFFVWTTVFIRKNKSGVSHLNQSTLKLHISITPKMVKKVIKNLDSSKASGPNYIPVVALKNCEPKPSYILAELFNVSKRILFSRFLEGFIGDPCI